MSSNPCLPPGDVVVTGAGRGLGRALLERLRRSGRPVVAVVRDAGRVEGIEAAIAGIAQALGPRPLAGLVNGAGAVTPIGPLAGHGSADLLRSLTLMTVAPARLSVVLAERMADGGRILNLSTRSAHATFPGLSLYCLSKQALHSVSRSLRLELPTPLAAAFLDWVLCGTTAAEFGRDEPWFIYDTSLQARWLPEGVVFDYPEP